MKPLFPEVLAGGFSSKDSTIAFYTRVRALLGDGGVVLDLGAGRGAAADDPVAYRRGLATLQNMENVRVIGADVDEAVLENPLLAEAHVIRSDGEIPLPDGHVNLVLSDWTLEHVTSPGPLVAEVARVLRSGGWFCARTPNRRGYISIINRLLPDRLHHRTLGLAQPDRQIRDVFPTAYKLNTREAVDEALVPFFDQVVVMHYRSEPGYFGRSPLAMRAVSRLEALLPERFASTLFVFARRA